jgi:hypothetical protein
MSWQKPHEPNASQTGVKPWSNIRISHLVADKHVLYQLRQLCLQQLRVHADELAEAT